MYSIEFTELAEKQFGKLDKEIQERIVKALERIRIRPEAYLEKLVGESGYKFRVGDYRLFIDLDGEKFTVLVLKMGHRKNFYKK